MPHLIELDDRTVILDGTPLQFPLSRAELSAELGAPSREVPDGRGSVDLVYDDLGLVFHEPADNLDWLRKRASYVDDVHRITGVAIYCGPAVRPQWRETTLPARPFTGDVRKTDGHPLWFISDRDEIGDLHVIRWTADGTGADGPAERIDDPLSVAFVPERTFPPANYRIRKVTGPVLEFADPNLKLAVVQRLMYELEVLTPRFDLFDFADQYGGKPIDTASTTVVRPALNWFKRLPIPAELGAQVDRLDMDGGDEVYLNIIPQWDGEDGTFDLTRVTADDLAQLPNLTHATLMARDPAETAAVFRAAGVEVD